MNGELVTLYNKRPGGQIIAVEMTRADADHALSTWPFAWSTSSRPDSFAPWPAMARRGKPCDPPSWAPPPGAA